MPNRKKLIRLTTHGKTLMLLKGQIGFLAKEMDILLVAKDTGGLKEFAAAEGVDYRDVDMHREISILNDLKSLWNLIKLFRKERPDIVHANTPKGALLAMAAAWLTRVPHRIYNVNGLRFETACGNFRRRHLRRRHTPRRIKLLHLRWSSVPDYVNLHLHRTPRIPQQRRLRPRWHR